MWSKILPPSIEVLTLRHCLECTVKRLAWLLKEKNRYVQNLEVVSLVYYVPMAEGEIPIMNSEVRKLAALEYYGKTPVQFLQAVCSSCGVILLMEGHTLQVRNGS